MQIQHTEGAIHSCQSAVCQYVKS